MQKVIKFIVDDELYKAVKIMAAVKGTSMSNIFREYAKGFTQHLKTEFRKRHQKQGRWKIA